MVAVRPLAKARLVIRDQRRSMKKAGVEKEDRLVSAAVEGGGARPAHPRPTVVEVGESSATLPLAVTHVIANSPARDAMEFAWFGCPRSSA